MNRKFLSWDCEIAAIVPEGETDWWQHAPLGITCAALAWLDAETGRVESRVFHPDGYADRMKGWECSELVWTLSLAAKDQGYTLLTHNGTSFDWRLLAMESGEHDECVDLALNYSVDTLLHPFCVKGFPLGLDAIAKGMGLDGKLEGMSGREAPQAWADGRYDEVLRYVEQDAVTGLEMALLVERLGHLRWISRRGKLNTLFLPGGWLTVAEALALPEPDTGWMDNPLQRSGFVDWMAQPADEQLA